MSTLLHANGKLLITGEYFVLDGAEALVLPLCYGQKLRVERITEDAEVFIQYEAWDAEEKWFFADFDRDLSVLQTNEDVVASRLRKIFLEVKKMQSPVFEKHGAYRVVSHLEFEREWGLGSSSTLIWVLGQWTGVDPLALHFQTSSGSGYDVAAAGQESPFIYSADGNTTRIESVSLSSSITQFFYFVYLGRKQKSNAEVDRYHSLASPGKATIRKISSFSRKMASCSSVPEVHQIIKEHEECVADFLGYETVKERLFPDWSGGVKSLGAWGGDFAMFVHEGQKEELMNYLATKDLSVCFSYDQIRVNPQLTQRIYQK